MEDFYTAYPLINQLYGVDITPENFEEIGLIAWRNIGNKYTKLYKYTESTTCDKSGAKPVCNCKDTGYFIDLPCNVDVIEAVTYGWEDWNYTTNTTPNGSFYSQFVENYIESRKRNTNPLYMSGSFVKYEQVGNRLYFERNYGPINVLYKGIVLNNDGLPYISDKEALAIATYCAMCMLRRDGLITKNASILQEAQLLQQEWLKQCSNARVPVSVSQNDMNEILDASSNWSRKTYNKSFKPVK